MRPTAVFLVKNGIGFGHIRRALLLADAVREAGRLRPVVISQASSLDLYRSRRVSVVNFPLLHRAPSAVAEDCYLEILDDLLDELDPTVVVEDTYPDARYGALPALREVPRLLVLRRLDGLSFDQIRTSGGFARYDKVLICQHEQAFHAEGHSPDSVAAVFGSGRFTFVGDLFHAPTASEVRAARVAHAPDGQRLVVVTAGAGGDQMPDGYGDRLFSATRTIARRLTSDQPDVRFVLVTGPYYAGRPLPATENITVHRFHPQLAALLAAADVAICKPGNNVLSEALTGAANLILVPDVSFMEGLGEHVHRITAEYGGAIARPTVEDLEPLVHKALARPPRQRRLSPNPRGAEQIVAAVHRHADLLSSTTSPVPRRQLLLVVAARAVDAVPELVSELLGNACLVDHPALRPDRAVARLSTLLHPGRPLRHAVAALVDTRPAADASPNDLARAGVTLLLTSGQAHDQPLQRWLHLRPPSRTLHVVDLHPVTARQTASTTLLRRITRLLTSRASAGLYLDLTPLATRQAVSDYLAPVAAWLREQPVDLTTPDTIRCHLDRSLLTACP